MYMKKMFLVIAILMSVIAMSVFADAVTVSKKAPATAKIGDNVRVNITVTNDGQQRIEVAMTENPPGQIVATDGELYIPDTPPGVIAAIPPVLQWSFSLPAGQTKVSYYTFKTEYLGPVYISPTEILAGGQFYETNAATVNVMCIPNGACGAGENIVNCPSDCSQGSTTTFQPTSTTAGLVTTTTAGVITTTTAGLVTTTTVPSSATTSVNPTTTTQKGEKESGSGAMTYLILLMVVVAAFLAYLFLKKRMGNNKGEYSDIVSRLETQNKNQQPQEEPKKPEQNTPK